MHAVPDLGFGLGLRAPHYEQFLSDRPRAVQWLEILSDNYLNAHAGYWEMLADLRRDYPMVLHGVSLNIGSTDPLDRNYLAALRRLADHLDVPFLSDHLCFTGVNRQHTHDLLPIPYTEEALAHLIPRIHAAQEAVGRPFAFENASAYVAWEASTIPEPEFLAALHQATGCGILLDINNIHVSTQNLGGDARAYLDAIPSAAVMQYHLAGYAEKGGYLLDTHGAPVSDPVWDLYTHALTRYGKRSTLIEWDSAVPPLATLIAELERARQLAEEPA